MVKYYVTGMGGKIPVHNLNIVNANFKKTNIFFFSIREAFLFRKKFSKQQKKKKLNKRYKCLSFVISQPYPYSKRSFKKMIIFTYF